MTTTITGLKHYTPGAYLMNNNAEIVNKWSKTAVTGNDRPEKEVCEAILSAIEHLYQPGACLHRLDLSASGLTMLPPVTIWQQLQGITILDVSQNALPGSELEKLGSINSLQQLYLNENPLYEIPDAALSGQKSLAILEADYCELSHFPSAILHLQLLDTLHLQGNPLNELPENIGYYLRSLIDLDVSDTGIRHMPESLNYLKEILRSDDK